MSDPRGPVPGRPRSAALQRPRFELRPLGDAGWLIDLDGSQQRRWASAAVDAVLAARFDSSVELVAGEHTLAVLVDPARWGRADLHELGTALLAGLDRADPSLEPARAEGDRVQLEVVYDGPDLGDVARQWGCTPADVVDWHRAQHWRVEFTGFMPGFGYLRTDRPRPVSRRDRPRPRIPTGSVGLAGEYSGVYPHSSPGGWQLIGRTAAALWRPELTPPALLVSDTEVRFVAVERLDPDAEGDARAEAR